MPSTRKTEEVNCQIRDLGMPYFAFMVAKASYFAVNQKMTMGLSKSTKIHL